MAKIPVCHGKASEFFKSSSRFGIGPVSHRKLPLYCDERKDVTDTILTIYSEVLEVKKIKGKTSAP